MLWLIASIFTVLGLALFIFLLWEKLPPIQAGSLALGDLMNLFIALLTVVGLAIALGSFYVAIAAYQKSVKDGEAQQKSLDASREQLQAVVETAKKQQEVLTQHLETSKAQLALQQELRRQENERASRKPKLRVFIEDKSFDSEKMTTGLAKDQTNRTRLPIRNMNIGSAPLQKPIFLAVASRKEVSIWFEGVNPSLSEPFTTQIGGNTVFDILPFSTSQKNYAIDLFVGVPSGITSFDITYTVIGENLDAPFLSVFHINLPNE